MNSSTDRQLQEAGLKLAELSEDVAILKLRLALKRYNPNEPRWPRGPWGGRWRATGTTAPPSSVNGTQEAGVYDEARMPQCLAQLALDEELCRMAKSSRCWERSRERYDNCMRDVYVPPLEVGR